MRRVLVIGYFFPPIANSGAMRPRGFCRYLPEFGWMPDVVSVPPNCVEPPYPVNPSLCDCLRDTVVVHRISHPDPIRTLLRLRDAVVTRNTGGGVPATAGEAKPRRRSALAGLRDNLLDHVFSFPDRQSPWVRCAVRFAAQYFATQPPDVVYATGGPWSSLLVGKALAATFGVPLVVDFRDPWTRNPFRRWPDRWFYRRAQLAERGVCTDAGVIIANTDELASQFRADYPSVSERVVTITNGYESSDFRFEPSSAAGTTAPADQPLTLEHFGTVYGKRSPVALLNAAEDLLRAGRLLKGRILLRFVGAWGIDDTECEGAARRLEAAGVVVREEAVPHAECVARMRGATALLAIQSESPLQIPAKIFEYVAVGRPVVLIGGEGATRGLVERHQLGVCYPNDRAALRDLLVRFAERDARLLTPGSTAPSDFDYANLTGRLAGVLASACTPK